VDLAKNEADLKRKHRMKISPTGLRTPALSLLSAVLASTLLASAAAAQSCNGAPRKMNVGVSVSPPNVVHTTAYVAKELGFFAKHCIDANIIQFDGGSSPAASVALTQGNTFATVSDVQVGRGMKVKQVWGLAPKTPQAYVVAEGIKNFADLKGKRLSAAGGGVGSFNWRIGREALSKASLTVDNAQFISQGTAGRLAGLVAGQIDAVSLHPEDAYLAIKQKPGLTILTQVADLMPLYSFNTYGIATDTIAKDRQAVVDFVAAMVEANRAIYRDKDKVIPIMVTATQKPREAVEYAWDVLTRNCIWSVNEGFEPERTQWTIDHDVLAGDIDAAHKPSVDQVIDQKIGSDGVALAGGRVEIRGCKL
jgi:ABC-type nitrate/sulfonate/bicarbonate transport system substrate-binding protein